MDNTRDDSEALIHAAEKGDVRLLSILLDEGAKVDARDMWGFTPLMAAAREGHSEIVRILLNHGADVNATCNAGWDSLVRAAERGASEIVSLLLKASANVDSKTISTFLNYGVEMGNYQLVMDLLELRKINSGDEILSTSLKVAINKGHTEIAMLLLDAGADSEAITGTLQKALVGALVAVSCKNSRPETAQTVPNNLEVV